jgi:hypothetical protein
MAESPRQIPPSEEYTLFSDLYAFAGGTRDHLRQCWSGTMKMTITGYSDLDVPIASLEASERRGLWYAFALSKSIVAATTLPTFMSLRDLWPDATVDERYVFQSAILTIRGTLPFTADEQAVLASEHNEDDWAFESMAITEHQPELVERWHDWIWSDERGYSLAPEAPRMGPSVMLAESCDRLYRLTEKGQREGRVVTRRQDSSQ